MVRNSEHTAQRASLTNGTGIGSDVLYFDVLGTSVIVLNSFKAAQELLEHRSGIYSSRQVTDSGVSVLVLTIELHQSFIDDGGQYV